jgi:hypothetical protein
MKKQNNIVMMAVCRINQVTVSTQMILQLKFISADNGGVDADNGAVVNTGHAAEHIAKEASDNFNAIQIANVSFNMV